MSGSREPVSESVLGCQTALFEWVESYDTKDWVRLSKCIANTIYLDYRSIMNKLWEAMPAEEYIGVISSPNFLGNTRLKTQHFVGATKWIQNDVNEITGYHQMRVAHQKYADDESKEVEVKGHAYGKSIIRYKRVNMLWKFAGITPDIRWSEYDYDKIFGA